MSVKSMINNYVDNVHRPNYSGYVVIGAGLPRTGTMSMRAALSQVLDGACYHMLNLASGDDAEADFWCRAMDGKLKDKDWVEFLEKRGFRAGVDYPISMFYKDLMRAFPNAKVLLTVRNPDTWYDSLVNTIYRQKILHQDFAVRTFMKLNGAFNTFDTSTRTGYFVPPGLDKGLFQAVEEGRESTVKFFNDWTEEVKKAVPKDRLLIHEAKQGWKPLCEFLDLPVPDCDYPRVNDTKQLQGMMTKIKRVSYLIVYGGPVLLGVVAYLLLNYVSV